ncbi:Uncharacterised protein [Zhongshania aliphaticivorans]|uniref:Uncharacterized protein n=1 Tax=Zhongshania aliphaticivorans TaxID=1470434 RepID=A0A5S9NFL3_9GAMM|nr:hypothetical protein [Zhongshania aliphaticivorans]CAA0089055.1 Uncharacterised protein [Zhongshania aliphaticivorans]CAA0095652.1 Uncharacterised protein [Zhongshania aliphaticivorans]
MFIAARTPRLFLLTLSLLSTFSMLQGCATSGESLSMPHSGPLAQCIEGDCRNGYGTKKAVNADYTIAGQWQEGEPTSGDYEVSYRGQTWTTQYRDGLPVQGAKLYPHVRSDEFDVFVGSWQRYGDPFSETTVVIPLEGTYVTSQGFHFSGVFKAFPTMGANRELYKSNPEGHYWPYLNAVFIGKIEYQGQKEVGVYARRDWEVGTPLIRFDPGILPADSEVLKRLQKETRAELSTLSDWQYSEKKSELNFDIGKILAIAAGVATAASSNLSAQQQTEFISAYSMDVMGGSTSNLQALQGKYGDNRSADEILTQFNKTAGDYYQQAQTQAASTLVTSISSNPRVTAPTATVFTSNKNTANAPASPQQNCLAKHDHIWLEDSQHCTRKASLAAKQCGQAGGGYTHRGCVINTVAYQPRFGGRTLHSNANLYPTMPAQSARGRIAASTDTQANNNECVARMESGMALPRVARDYCRYILTDDTRTAEFTFEGASWGFDSSSTEEAAKKLLKDNLIKLAKKKCGTQGYSVVFHDDTLEAYDINPYVKECKSRSVFGSEEYICRGNTSFFCGRYQ